jgi:hypothetical protein
MNVFISRNSSAMAQFKETECSHFQTRQVFKDCQGNIVTGNWKRTTKENYDFLKSDFVESTVLKIGD